MLITFQSPSTEREVKAGRPTKRRERRNGGNRTGPSRGEFQKRKESFFGKQENK